MSRYDFWSALLATVALAACQEPRRAGPPAEPAPGGPGTTQPAEPGTPLDGGSPNLDYPDETFVETDVQNRDPFRSYAEPPRAPEIVQREVVMPRTNVDQMRLIAVISGTPRPSAMLVDETGVGHVVRQGDFIGRAEVIQSGGPDSTPILLNWRIERIRPSEIVLSRTDTSDESRPPLTRVLPLHEES